MQHWSLTKPIFKLVGLLSVDEVDHLRELNTRKTKITIHHQSGVSSQPSLSLSYLSTNVVPDHLLDHHIGERLKVLDKLLVLVVARLLLNKELEEGGLLPAHSGHVGRFLGHLQQQPQQISHA